MRGSNFHTDGNRVISYTTHVANINHQNETVERLGWWSQTTSKHINKVARELGYRVVDAPKQTKAQPAEQESELGSAMRTTAMVAAMGELLLHGEGKAEKNNWKARMIKAGLGDAIQMPDDWDRLSEDEKERRLNAVIEELKGK